MVAQINAQRVAAGKSTLGWINPSLYSLSSSSILLNDITSGNNKCTEGGKICCAQGFYARPGWDPVTGVGSVNFTAMSEAFFKLGDEPNVPTLAPTAVSSLSSMPVAAPSVAPSAVPTALPTNTAGWLYANMYTGENCAGTNFQVMGQPTGTCLPMYNEDEELIGARMYSCGTGKVFSLLACTGSPFDMPPLLLVFHVQITAHWTTTAPATATPTTGSARAPCTWAAPWSP